MGEDFLLTEDRIGGEFNVSFAERRIVGEEWNLVEWNRKHHEIDCHRLYFRADDGKANAVLTLFDKKIQLEKNKVYFIPAFSVLQSEIDGQMDKYYIHFRSNNMLFGLYRYLSGEYQVDATPITQTLFDIVVENYSLNTEQSKMKVQGAMNLLLAEFISQSSINSHALVRYKAVLEYIEKNYRKEISVNELASIMNVSTTYFANSFKKAFHISPKQYILNKRLTESQQLLLETDMSVKEIAYLVGFENENYFSEFFAQKTGVSALKYRKRAFPKERDCIL
jgi:AraC-like DNA-binding protein